MVVLPMLHVLALLEVRGRLTHHAAIGGLWRLRRPHWRVIVSMLVVVVLLLVMVLMLMLALRQAALGVMLRWILMPVAAGAGRRRTP